MRSRSKASQHVRWMAAVALLSLALGWSSQPVSSAQTLSEDALAKIDFEQKLQAQVTPGLKFVDEDNREITLGSYFGQKPIILVLGYYQCPMLCTLVLNGLIEGLQQIKWSIGSQFDVLCVSVDPSETASLAAAKKRVYLKRYARAGAAQGWHFLTGPEASIRTLAHEVGFQYAYDPVSKQYAHPSGLVILTPEGKVSAYLFGVTFEGQELNSRLEQAANHKIGSPIARLILLCFHYNPITGRYGALILTLVRVLGAVTFLALAGLVIGLTRKPRLRAYPPSAHS